MSRTFEPVATPVVLCVYNRPALTREVLTALSVVKPRHILVVADGPKINQPGDREKCDAVIELVKAIDWPARVEWNVAPLNLGIRDRIQSGLAWAFSLVEEAIILEDDCVPHPSFFGFCAELIEKYRNDSRVAVISGSNFQFDQDCGDASYFFSRYPLVWGWATWRRTWKIYDPHVSEWPALRETSWLHDYLGEPLVAAYWRAIFDRVLVDFSTYDYSLTFSCWRSRSLAIHPARNLIKNIGFGDDATHTHDPDSIYSRMPVHEMEFPLIHPARVERSIDCDLRTENIVFSGSAREQLQRVRTARLAGATPSIWKPRPS